MNELRRHCGEARTLTKRRGTEYIEEHRELNGQVRIEVVIDFDPNPGMGIRNSKNQKDGIHTQMEGEFEGWLANQKEQGPHIPMESKDTGDHGLFSFFNEIPMVDGSKWVEQAQEYEQKFRKK